MGLGSLDGRQDQAHARSAEVVGHLFRVTALEVVLGRGSSWIPCTGSSVVVTGVVFGLQINKWDPANQWVRRVELRARSTYEVRQLVIRGEVHSSLKRDTEVRSMVRADLIPGDYQDASVWFRLHWWPRQSRGLWVDGELQRRVWLPPQLRGLSRAKSVDLRYEIGGSGVVEEVLFPQGCTSRNPIVFLDRATNHGPEQGALQD